MEDRGSFGWGWERGEETEKGEGPRGRRGRQTRPRALSGFLLPALNPSTFSQRFRLPGVCSACCLPACLPATKVRPTPARSAFPSSGRIDPHSPLHSCSVCTGRGGCAGRSGISNAVGISSGSIASPLEGRRPGLAAFCFPGATTV